MRFMIIALAACLASPACAQPGASAQHLPGAPARPAPPPGTITQLHEKFAQTTSASDELDSDNFTLDPSATVTIDCDTQCTVITDTLAQVSAFGHNNLVAICPEIDGTFTTGSCYLVVTTSSKDPSPHPVPLLSNLTVPAGTHTLQVYLYSQKKAAWTIRQTVYHVYE